MVIHSNAPIEAKLLDLCTLNLRKIPSFSGQSKRRNNNLKFYVHKSSSLAYIDSLSYTVNHHPNYFLFIQFLAIKSQIPILLF